jgi:hypothetical protein
MHHMHACTPDASKHSAPAAATIQVSCISPVKKWQLVFALLQECLSWAYCCGAAVDLTDTNALARLKVKHLKAILADKGLDCRECVEKADYVSFLSSHIAASHSGAHSEL